MTEARARRAAQNIREYWARKGYEVTADVHREPYTKGASRGRNYSVRTNLKNGLPPDFKGKKSEFRP